MLDEGQRRAILELHSNGVGSRRIAQLLGVSRGAVRGVIKGAVSEVPRLIRAEKAEPHREEIMALYSSCKGNLVRVHEELIAAGAELSYQALTSFCRRHGIGKGPKQPVGRYHFGPGKEMQHDTSPHRVKISGREVLAQTASLVLCYSRLLFFQIYPRFDRFTCKIFLTDALQYMGGSCDTCMIDNTHVVVLRGTGAQMVPVPEMAAFGERYGFSFAAHEKGDKNRSARVERPFHFIENNFLVNREFADWAELNERARTWCDEKNATFRRHLHASPRELFATEQPTLQPLPPWVPEVYRLHHRIVDVEAYVSVHAHRYSVPYEHIGRRVEVRETKDRILVYAGPRETASHDKVMDTRRQRVTHPGHRPPRRDRVKRAPPEEETSVIAAAPELSVYVTELRRRSPGRGTLALRRLLRMVREYPREPLLAAVRCAHHYGLYDLERLERMVLRNIGDAFFSFDAPGDDDCEGPDDT
jgi:predicted transcriptional regulator